MYYSWLGKTLSCVGMTVQLTDELSERCLSHLGEWVVVAHGKARETDELVTVKLRVEVDPAIATDVDHHDREVALRDFANESAALEDSSDSGHTPRYLTHGEMRQDHSMPYTGGYIRALVMSRVPGQDVRHILLELSEEERTIIRDQLTRTLEHMRRKGWHYRDPKPGNLVWDKATRKMYLVDLGSAEYLGEGTGDRITPESNIVEMFGVWNRYARRNDQSLPFNYRKSNGGTK